MADEEEIEVEGPEDIVADGIEPDDLVEVDVDIDPEDLIDAEDELEAKDQKTSLLTALSPTIS